MTDRVRVPAHILVMLSTCTAGYGITLAAVASAQSRSDADLVAQRAPAVDGLGSLGRDHDALNDRLEAARTSLDEALAAYHAVGGNLDGLEAGLTNLASSVARIDGLSKGLPTSIKLPSIRSVSPVTTTTHTTTGAS